MYRHHNEFSFSADMIDVRDLIARYEYIEDSDDEEELAEARKIKAILDDLGGCGDDEQWRGKWYPLSLIRDSYFVEAMQDFVQDIGDWPRDIPAYLEIDWEKTADNLRVDYSNIEIDGTDYWYR